MQKRSTIAVASVVALAVTAILVWQGWTTHKAQQQVASLQQQMASLQQQLAAQGGSQSGTSSNGSLAPAPGPQQNSPLAPPGQSPVNPPANGRPLWGGQDPFTEMQRMQQQMHQRMRDLMSDFGFDKGGSSLFDMDPFQNGRGFGSSMGFGDDPEFEFSESGDKYQVTLTIPKDSKIEISTAVNGRDLTVEGKVTVEQQNQNQGSRFQALQTRQFARTFNLPDDVDALGISTQNTDGKVVVTLPKLPKGQHANPSTPAKPPKL